jgi:uncharacterized protein DUF2690
MLKARLAGLALAVVSVAALTVGGATSAQAVTCTYNNCNGKNPETAGCSAGSTTLKNFVSTKGVKVELRYSSACHATWTRISAACIPNQKPYIETGYIDYYGTYHKQNAYYGKPTLFGCTGHDNPPREVQWTAMSSYHRERIRFGVDNVGTLQTYVHTTGCDDCS